MKILVLTTLYRDIDDSVDAATTPVVHNFAKEWVKQGHEVILIHNFNIFPGFFYLVPQIVWDKLSSKVGFRTILNKKQTTDKNYIRDGVNVYRSTIKKALPLGSFSNRELDNSVKKIANILEENAFTPDLIAAHMENPQIYQIAKLKEYYPEAITSLVIHHADYLTKPKFELWKNEYFPKIDVIGFRSPKAYRDACTSIGFDREDYFYCPSGISEDFLKEPPRFTNKFLQKELRILYVGQLIPRKHVGTLIEAAHILNEKNAVKISIEIVGDGVEKKDLIDMVQRYGLQDCITFLGRLNHNEVMKKMKWADIFVMVSSGEVFGLVYLEAMSQGCIVVASTDGGMEGIIKDAENGFLSPAGDPLKLSEKITYISSLERNEQIELADKSYKTSLRFSEYNVATDYLDNIIKIYKKH